MLACLDVHYRGDEAGILFQGWEAERGAAQLVERVRPVAPYEPGRFYARELPCLLRLLGRIGQPLDVVVIDGYVWLGPGGEPGLGGHLYAALGRTAAVVGVAKSPFKGAAWAAPVLRGRIPMLLAEVDRLCREGSLQALRR